LLLKLTQSGEPSKHIFVYLIRCHAVLLQKAEAKDGDEERRHNDDALNGVSN
jgi:hypothetical protein